MIRPQTRSEARSPLTWGGDQPGAAVEAGSAFLQESFEFISLQRAGISLGQILLNRKCE